MDRRKFICTLAAALQAGTAVTLPTASGRSVSGTAMVDPARLLQVIEQLEAHQEWESISVVAAKHFAARQFREALALPPTDSLYPKAHVDFQRARFERHHRTLETPDHVREPYC